MRYSRLTARLLKYSFFRLLEGPLASSRGSRIAFPCMRCTRARRSKRPARGRNVSLSQAIIVVSQDFLRLIGSAFTGRNNTKIITIRRNMIEKKQCRKAFVLPRILFFVRNLCSHSIRFMIGNKKVSSFSAVSKFFLLFSSALCKEIFALHGGNI